MSTIQERIAADLSKFVSPTVFGKTATYAPTGGTPSAINIIYDKAYRPIDLVDGTFEGAQLSALCRTTDVATVKQGDLLVIGGINHYVLHVHPDLEGMTRLILSLDNIHG